jgi:DNA-directed RNA polymerase subunit beta'
MLAFWPRITKNKAIEISPLIVKGFNADFDGDAMSFHVPVSEESRREVIERMLPSKDLISPRDFTSPVHYPTQEYVLGLYFGTRAKKTKKPPKVFATVDDVRKALMRGEIDPSDPVVVMRESEPKAMTRRRSVVRETA